jgi:hypothetical protein
MPESLWQAVQMEVDKQQGQAPAQGQAATRETVASAPRNIEPDVESDRRPDLQTEVSTMERPKERRVERRPYDFYTDQVLWLKEMKLEIEKRYGKRVAANEMVQLAVDLLIEDYEQNKERSKLVLKLVADGS